MCSYELAGSSPVSRTEAPTDVGAFLILLLLAKYIEFNLTLQAKRISDTIVNWEGGTTIVQ